MPSSIESMIINISSNVKGAVAGVDKINKKFEGLGKKIGAFSLGAAGALGAFAVGIGIKSVNAAKDLDSAVKNLGRQVGASSSEMKEYEGIITDLYKKNIGENFQDVADIIGEIKRQTQLAGEELKDFTGYAAKFGKVYDTEIAETTRAANMLMKEFGIETTEAFNLMVQGMEKGLNKNDDFLDSINEYSVHFKNLGFDAEDMFNLFISGAESGAWSIDKLGDAVKEFNIRVKDNSDSTIKAFKDLGFKAEDTMKIFANGGDDANETFKDVLKNLGKIQDKIKRDEIGVALFGTMWEDLGADVILSMDDIDGAFDSTKNSADALNSIDYTDFDSMMSALGRTVETDLLIPLGQELLPVLFDISGWAGERLPGVIDKFKEWGRTVKKFFEDRGGIKNTANQFWTDIFSIEPYTKKWDELTTELGKIGKSFEIALLNVRNIMDKKFTEIWAKAYLWGRNVIQTFLAGMFSMFTSIAYVCKNAAKIIRSYLGWYSPTEKGPGRDSDEWAPNFMEMFTDGISMSLPKLEQSVQMTAGSMESGFSQNITPNRTGASGSVQLVNANIYNETMLNMLMNRIKRELVSGGI